MEQLDIRTDNNRNRFYCILKGFFLESEIDLAFNKISLEVQNLTDGFDVILDIHDLKTHPEYLKELFYEKLRNLIQANCRYIFNVIPDNRIKPLRELEK